MLDVVFRSQNGQLSWTNMCDKFCGDVCHKGSLVLVVSPTHFFSFKTTGLENNFVLIIFDLVTYI